MYHQYPFQISSESLLRCRRDSLSPVKYEPDVEEDEFVELRVGRDGLSGSGDKFFDLESRH